VKKQRKLLGSGAITDGETDAKNASVDSPLDGLSREGQGTVRDSAASAAAKWVGVGDGGVFRAEQLVIRMRIARKVAFSQYSVYKVKI
jgi:hypothetical protein